MPKNKDKIVAEGERWDRFLDWLLTGKGKMYKDGSEEPVIPLEDTLFDVSQDVETVPGTREISHILIFYKDNTFQEFHPAQ